jgi:hypothetical protein
MSARWTAVMVVCLILLLAGTGYALMGPIPAGIFTVFLIGGFVAWRFTTYGAPAAPERIVAPYLLTVILFIVHVLEEYLTGFWSAMTELTGHPISELQFMLVAAFIGPILWLLGLVLAYMRTEIGNYLMWAFFVAMTISELAHFVFPIASGGFGYFPGLYTAALPLVPAAVGIRRLLADVSARKARQATP